MEHQQEVSECRTEQRFEEQKGNEQDSQFADAENGSQTNEVSECRTQQRFEELKGNEQESQFPDGENGSQTDEGYQESTNEKSEKESTGTLQLLQFTEGSEDASEWRKEQRLEQLKGNEQESQFAEGENGNQTDEGTQASECRTEQRFEKQKGNEQESQFADDENENQTDERNEGSECRTEQRFEEQKGNKQASQFTEGDNGSQADEENQEYRNEQRFEEQKGNEQESQFSEGENGSQTGEENQKCRTEQRFEEQKGNEQESQFTEGENGSQTIAKNQESMSEKGEKGLMRTLQSPQCTECAQDGSSRVKRYDQIEVTSRSPIKNQRKRHIAAVSGYGTDSESPEPLKKSPKGPVPAYGLDAESLEPLKKSPKDGTSVGRYLQKEPDGPPVAAKGSVELQPCPEPEKMDFSDDTSRVSPDGNQSEDNNDLTPQNSTDEDMDSESEMKADGLQDPTGPSTQQTFSAGGMQTVSYRQPRTPYSCPAQADIQQSMSYRVPQNHTETQRGVPLSRQRVADYGTKQTTHKGPFPSTGNMPRVFHGKSPLQFSDMVQADIRQSTNYRKLRNYTDAEQSAQFIRPSVAGSNFFWKLVIPIIGLIAVLSACVFCLWISKVTDQQILKEREELLLGKWKEMETMFPNQQKELWARSSILLKKHVGTAVHTQPVILMFAAAQDAHGTMQCLARRVGETYASVFNSNTLEINGSDMKSWNSDAAKLELDKRLSSAFQEGRKAAIIHHFQDFPPPSTLLFYKYCDHEHAAFKDVSLLITVLLDKPTLKPDLPLKDLEETVQDFLKKLFCSNELQAFNVMDADKLGGLWSRIAHLVLPVRVEREIEDGDCPV
ncbi:torsin-1A-interacting protein 1-like isoform X2 [Carcharodon carcharias]|uniref:torsin-1A-interacting protein 1-like isoform X2 n=1 Tax=Carcharodon carcharias TaxID=13397 RepID=UPI001B7F5AD1|nr:torsin-1A-interacting protein 1-like isoform X2 [Carcharodon carcharias]